MEHDSGSTFGGANGFGSTTSTGHTGTMGSTGSTNNTVFQRKQSKHLTVESTAKIDVESDDDDQVVGASVGTVIAKWVATVLLFFLLLGLVVQSKISLLALTERLHRNNTASVLKNPERLGQLRLFSCILILILIPPIVNLARGVWSSAFRKDLPWPKKRAFFVGFIISASESVGLSLFVFTVPATGLQVYHLPLMMNWVLVLPVAFSIYRCCARDGINKSWYLALFVLAALALLSAIGFSIVVLNKDKNLQMNRIWAIPVAVLCLSVSWLPRVQSYLLQVETGQMVDPELPTDSRLGSSSRTYENLSGLDIGSTATRGSSSDSIPIEHMARSEEVNVTVHHVTETSRPTWKLTIYMSVVKIIITFSFSLVVFKYFLLGNGQPSMSDFRDSWDLNKLQNRGIYYMVANSVGSLLGYLVGYMACTTCLHRGGYALPLFASTPLTFALLANKKACTSILIDSEGACQDVPDLQFLAISVGCLFVAQVLSTGWLIWSGQSVVMQKEHQLFWMPTYNSVMLEQWMFLARRNQHTDEQHEDPSEKAKRSKIIICTTMYRESKNEMKQLLQSIGRINKAQRQGSRHFESHIFFDGAVKDRNPTDFVLQLVSLVDSTLGIKPELCCKTLTPYGMTLAWKLPGERDRGMTFTIHLKDNVKVKNKKRWSQVMYMSYVLDFLMQQHDNATEEDTYILTTDADVKFTPDNVEALLDLMTRDQSVGAVCARTHPLGSGPIVWYQVFEYAIGHWFQKAAEHVIGSVLCSPGCFSVYRCKALREILPKYATNVEHAFDFLTKDMGEDRWLCTLMVQSGWRIEYCAASENSTYCPEEFEEFFKQRRRWVASTLANIMLLLKEWNLITKFNQRIPFVFLLYQGALLFATLIGPGSVMMVVSGGLVYGWNVDPITTLVLQGFVCVGFGIICVRTTSKFQMRSAKTLTFIYSIIMIAVLVGTMVQIASDFSKADAKYEKDGNDTELVTTTANPALISKEFPISTTTLYIILLASVFLFTGILHGSELFALSHGLVYFLCLPSGYLILMIYSICNITDRSWGTREEVTMSVVAERKSWIDIYKKYFKMIFFCCFKDEPTNTPPAAENQNTLDQQSRNRGASFASVADLDAGPLGFQQSLGPRSVTPFETRQQSREDFLESFRLASIGEGNMNGMEQESQIEDDDLDDTEKPKDVQDWLPRELHQYLAMFKKHGYDNTMLISGMTEKELKSLGVKRKGIRTFLLEDIKTLPDFEIQAEVPDNVDLWLKTIGLPQYYHVFKREHIITSKDMEVLKSFGRDEIEKELKITKSGHIKRLLKAIEKLRNPTPDERSVLETKRCLEVVTVHDLKHVNVEENAFWERLQKFCLLPASKAFSSEEHLKLKLGDLRNGWLVVMAVSNLLWVILISTLANKGKLLAVAGSNPVGLIVVVVFSFVLIVQFGAMVIHRIGTLVHFLGRAPYRCGQSYNTSWTFTEKASRGHHHDEDAEAIRTTYESQQQAKRRLDEKKDKKYRSRKAVSSISVRQSSHNSEESVALLPKRQ